jgi:predicted regulator of Ras-like GTPase activity (Roadblock/LC7/MglB family)
VSNIQETLDKLLTTDGAMAAALVDSSSGLLLGKAGSGLDLDVAAAGNTEVVRAKLKTIKSLGLDEQIDDILITLSSQYHIIRPLTETPEVFLYLVLDTAKSNLALARINTKKADAAVEF